MSGIADTTYKINTETKLFGIDKPACEYFF